MKSARAKLAKTSGTLGLAALAVIASPYAMADDSGWYAGANVGQSRAKIDDERITRNLLGSGFTSISINSTRILPLKAVISIWASSDLQRPRYQREHWTAISN